VLFVSFVVHAFQHFISELRNLAIQGINSAMTRTGVEP